MAGLQKPVIRITVPSMPSVNVTMTPGFLGQSGYSGYSGVVGPGVEGGSGTAGAGKQYVTLTINGITYKLLHDGQV